jgi:hypothetical protein
MMLGVVVVQILNLEPNPLVQLALMVSIGTMASAQRNVFARQNLGELRMQQSIAQKQYDNTRLGGLVALHFS